MLLLCISLYSLMVNFLFESVEDIQTKIVTWIIIKYIYIMKTSRIQETLRTDIHDNIKELWQIQSQVETAWYRSCSIYLPHVFIPLLSSNALPTIATDLLSPSLHHAFVYTQQQTSSGPGQSTNQWIRCRSRGRTPSTPKPLFGGAAPRPPHAHRHAYQTGSSSWRVVT